MHAPSHDAWRRATRDAIAAKEFRSAHRLCIQVLTREPNCAEAFFLLGLIAAEHNNLAKAADVISRAIRLDATQAEYHAHLARCLVILNRHQEARAVAETALTLIPADALTLDTLGVVWSRLGEHTIAVELFRRAVARDGTRAEYFYNLGSSLQFSGLFQEAQAAYRRCLALDESFHRARSGLSQLTRKSTDDNDIPALEAQLERPGLGVDAELHLCHALAKEHEDLGHFHQAFHYLVRGKRRKRATLEYSIADDQKLFETAREVCSAEVVTGSNGCPSKEAIFIVGMPRTGTTLVERVLSSHETVFAAGELTDFSLVLKRITATAGNTVLDPATLRAAADADACALGEAYLQSTRPRTGHTAHFIDKMPLNFFYAGLIHRALPNARIICLRRNPLDTCLSNFRQLFASRVPYYRYAYDLLDTGRYYALFDALTTHWRGLMPHHFRELHYEDLVADPERETRTLLEFCGLGWDPRCLRFFENPAPVATASSIQVRSPLYRSSVGRWKHYAEELAELIALLTALGIDWRRDAEAPPR